jgi:hypothetical protein
MAEIDPEEIIVTVAHPHGDVEVSLGEWIRTGPGERPLVRPVAARTKSGRRLSMSHIPLKYRNTRASRALIRAGFLEDPWSGK